MKEWTDEYNPFNPMKVLKWSKNIEAILDGNFLPPVTVNLDLMEGCNYNCPECIWIERKDNRYEIPTEIALKIPKFLHDWGVKSVFMAGGSGDPSLHKDLHKILKELHNWNLDIGLITNGLVLKDKKLRAAAHYTKFVGFSMDAGTEEAYAIVHGVPESFFDKVLNNISVLDNYRKKNDLDMQIGYKFLLFPESYHTLYKAAEIARDIGVNHFQIRPAELSAEKTKQIDIDEVNKQIEKARGLETDSFGVFGIRHKFKPDLTKLEIDHCYVTPLTSTWLANGDVILCADSRDKNYEPLCNYIEDGLQTVRELWGTKRHRDLIKWMNENLHNCKRCAYSGYNSKIKNMFVEDKMDARLI